MNTSKRKGQKQNTTSRTVAYFKNGIGNWVLMTPALQALATLDASGKIILCTDSTWNDSRTKALNDIWAATPWIETVIRYLAEGLAVKPERIYYSKHSEGGDAFTWFQALEPNFGNQITWTGSMMHEVDYYMELARQLGYKGSAPRQFFPAGGTNPIAAGEKYVVICNGAFGKMKMQKQWPRFPELVRVLKARYGITVYSVGNGDELRDTRDVVTKDYVGKLDILDSAAVVRDAKLFITTDTGMMHIADALNIPQIVLFGGTIASKNGPLSTLATVVRSDASCQPCQYTADFDTCADARCMRELTVGEVMAYAANWL